MNIGSGQRTDVRDIPRGWKFMKYEENLCDGTTFEVVNLEKDLRP